MLVTYVAPNRAHHYTYAKMLAQAGVLQRFVCGASRFGPRAALPEVGKRLLRADEIQNVYLASLKFGWPSTLSEELTYLSKIWLDRRSENDARKSDAFLFYSGTGLHTLRALKPTPTVTVMEAVNSHILVQEQILREEHDRLGLPLKGFHRREVRRRVREIEEADAVICPSTFSRQSFLDQGLPPERVRVVPFGIEVAVEPVEVERPDDVFRVLYVGQINLRKGLRYLFQAFARFRHPRKELWIVGPTTEQTGISDLTPPEGTRFLGVLKGAELARVYRACHVFVLPTLEEGLALVIGEALAHGLPVIATVNSGAADLFADGTSGYLVPIRAPEAITAKLQLLADQREIREELSAQAISPEGRRSWEMVGESLIETLRELTHMPKRQP